MSAHLAGSPAVPRHRSSTGHLLTPGDKHKVECGWGGGPHSCGPLSASVDLPSTAGAPALCGPSRTSALSLLLGSKQTPGQQAPRRTPWKDWEGHLEGTWGANADLGSAPPNSLCASCILSMEGGTVSSGQAIPRLLPSLEGLSVPPLLSGSSVTLMLPN